MHKERFGYAQGLVGLALALVLSAAGTAALAACGGAPADPDSVPTEQPAASDDATPSDGDATTDEGQDDGSDEQASDAPASQADGADADAPEPTFPDECCDRHGDPTVYALSELTGEQLGDLLAQQGYGWNERNLIWLKEDGSVAVAAYDPSGSLLGAQRIAELGAAGAEGAACYRLSTSSYATVQRALDGLVSKVMVCEDSVVVDDTGVAVAYGPSMRRVLVFATKDDDVVSLTVLGEDAVAAGLFDQLAGQALGGSIDEVFEALTGRAVGSEH